MPIASVDFDLVRRTVFDTAGIVIEPGKEYLVESRLNGLARKQGLPSLDELLQRLKRDDESLRRDVIEAMTTNETTFFRDGAPFELFKTEVLPRLIAARASTRELSIWCAASSTGQEPYSLAILLAEHFPSLESWHVRILATDLSQDVLARARAGCYSQIEVNRGLPITYLVKYFEKHGAEWRLVPRIRERVEFRQMNLVQAWPLLPSFDVVFIRNVMIYFDVSAKKSILQRIGRVLRPDGYLFLGAAETTMNLDDRFRRAPFDRAGCYQIQLV
jgi:chemotaxis protein methyltransferase CheR